MPAEKPRELSADDERVEKIVGNLLRFGVVMAGLVVLAGGIYYLCEHGGKVGELRTFQGEPADLRDPLRIIADAWSLDSRGIIQFGLLLLVATPVARVVFLLGAFLLRRDFLYLAITLIVLTALLYSMFGSGS